MKKARVIQICGTGSGVGKSVIVAGLCRVLYRKGYRVAPFKAQNMALNSAVTSDGGEIGRAQAMQAAACRIDPSVEMNPVLLKPTSHVGSQVIVQGKVIGNMTAVEYYENKRDIFNRVKKSLNHLIREYDVIVIEGAGSPAEINLKKHDIVNMRIARLLNAPVLLVGDIDCGGVFAWLWGTLMLLSKKEQSLVKGFIINKFRGDKKLLVDGLRFIERKSHKKVFGVLPMYQNIALPEEDSLFFDQYKPKKKFKKKCVHIAVIQLPHISNFTDFDSLLQEEDVILEYTLDPEIIKSADCIIIPGSKNTLEDMSFLDAEGLSSVIKSSTSSRSFIIGICGGFQMLGKHMVDKLAVESSRKERKGLGLLPMITYFEKKKSTYQVQAVHISTNKRVLGYEIHHGKTLRQAGCKPMFKILKRGDKKKYILDGASNRTGNIWGTYLHGIFDNWEFRNGFLNRLRKEKGLKMRSSGDGIILDDEFEKLADLFHAHMDINAIEKIIFSQKMY